MYLTSLKVYGISDCQDGQKWRNSRRLKKGYFHPISLSPFLCPGPVSLFHSMAAPAPISRSLTPSRLPAITLADVWFIFLPLGLCNSIEGLLGLLEFPACVCVWVWKSENERVGWFRLLWMPPWVYYQHGWTWACLAALSHWSFCSRFTVLKALTLRPPWFQHRSLWHSLLAVSMPSLTGHFSPGFVTCWRKPITRPAWLVVFHVNIRWGKDSRAKTPSIVFSLASVPLAGILVVPSSPLTLNLWVRVFLLWPLAGISQHTCLQPMCCKSLGMLYYVLIRLHCKTKLHRMLRSASKKPKRGDFVFFFIWNCAR